MKVVFVRLTSNDSIKSTHRQGGQSKATHVINIIHALVDYCY